MNALMTNVLGIKNLRAAGKGVRAVLASAILWIVSIATLFTPLSSANDFVADSSFGKRGVVTGSIGPVGERSRWVPMTLSRYGRNKVVFGVASRSEWQIRRFGPTGSPDLSFGNFGLAKISTWGGVVPPPDPRFDAATANLSSLTVEPDGQIMVAGYLNSDITNEPWKVTSQRHGTARMALARLLPSGAPDLSFGTSGGGRVFGWYQGAIRLQPTTGGNFLIGGFYQYANVGDSGLVNAFLADGRKDPGFNGDRRIDFKSDGHKTSTVFDLDRTSGDQVILSGAVQDRLFLARIGFDGHYDRKFGKDGRVTVRRSRISLNWAGARDTVIDSKGRLIVAGYGGATQNGLRSVGLLMRFQPDGQLDRTFGRNGVVRISANGPRLSYGTRFYGVSLDPTGGIWVTGMAGNMYNRKLRHGIVVRFNTNGTKDQSFFHRGIKRISMGDSSVAYQPLRFKRKMYVFGSYDVGANERYFLQRLKMKP